MCASGDVRAVLCAVGGAREGCIGEVAFSDGLPQAWRNLPFPEPSPAAQGGWGRSRSSSHLAGAGGSKECGLWDPTEVGVGRRWEGQQPRYPSVRITVCAGRVWHIPEETGWSLSGWTGLGLGRCRGKSKEVHSQRGRRREGGPRLPG